MYLSIKSDNKVVSGFLTDLVHLEPCGGYGECVQFWSVISNISVERNG
jgi:hypothetical protein